MKNLLLFITGTGNYCAIWMVLLVPGLPVCAQSEATGALDAPAEVATLSTEDAVRELLQARQWRKAMILAQQAREEIQRHQLALIVTEELVRQAYFADAADNLRYVKNHETKALAYLTIAHGQADNGTELAHESLKKAVKAAKKIEDPERRKALLERLSQVKLNTTKR